MDIRFYLTLLLQRLPYVLIFVLLGSAAGLTVAMILPPRYVASAQLVVERQQIPDDLASSTVSTGATEQLEIIRQRILTRATLLDLADEFEVYERVEGEALSPDDIVTDMRARITIAGTDNRRRRDQGATLISVSFAAESARLAAAVANEVVTLILDENIEMRTATTGETLDFFEGEVTRLDQALAQTSARITAFQEENRDALPSSLEFRREQLLSAQDRLVTLERELVQLRERRRNLETLARQAEISGADDDALSPEARRLRELRDRYSIDLTVYSEQNPRMVDQRRVIEALAEIVAEQAIAAGATTEEGEVLTQLDIQLGEIDDQIAFLEERRIATEEQAASLDLTIDATPGNAITLSRLERDLANIQRQYDRAVEARARAETGDTIEALAKGQRISIIESATPPESPTSPNRRRIAIMGFGGGLLAGLGLVALLELLNTSVRRGVEIERALDITPIATLSYMRTAQEVARRRMIIASAALVAVAGVPAGLWAVHAFYKPIDLVALDVLERLPRLSVVTDALQGTF